MLLTEITTGSWAGTVPEVSVDALDQHRVAGWVALTAPPSAGPVSIYRVDKKVLIVEWRDGPTAPEFAEHLMTADPSMTVTTTGIRALDPDDLQSEVEVGDVRVILRHTPADDGWTWEIGVPASNDMARDHVIWTVPPESAGVGCATVVRLPASVTEDPYWSQESLLVVNVSDSDRLAHNPQLAAAARLASLRVRVGHDWNLTEADEWLEEQTTQATGCVGATAMLLGQACLLRIHTGLRITVTTDNPHLPSMPWGLVPATVYDSLLRVHDHHVPPTKLEMRVFGDAHTSYPLRLETTLAVPTTR